MAYDKELAMDEMFKESILRRLERTELFYMCKHFDSDSIDEMKDEVVDVVLSIVKESCK